MLMLLGREGWDISGVIFFPQHLQLSNGSSKAKQNTAKKIASLGAGWREHEYKQGCWWQDVNIKDECTEAEGIQMFTELLTSLLKPTPDFWEARQWYVCMEHCSTDRCLPVLLSKCSQLRERSPRGAVPGSVLWVLRAPYIPLPSTSLDSPADVVRWDASTQPWVLLCQGWGPEPASGRVLTWPQWRWLSHWP